MVRKIKRTMGILVTIVMVMLVMVSPVNALTVSAAENTVPNITIKVPGCNATFTLNNVSSEYGVYTNHNGESVYIFVFPDRDGYLYCDSPVNCGCASKIDDFGEIVITRGELYESDEDWSWYLGDWEFGTWVTLNTDSNGNLDYTNAVDGHSIGIDFVFGDAEGFVYDRITWTNGWYGGDEEKELPASGMPEEAVIYPITDLAI